MVEAPYERTCLLLRTGWNTQPAPQLQRHKKTLIVRSLGPLSSQWSIGHYNEVLQSIHGRLPSDGSCNWRTRLQAWREATLDDLIKTKQFFVEDDHDVLYEILDRHRSCGDWDFVLRE